MNINKKSTIFVPSSWNLVKMITLWGNNFHQVSWGWDKNCVFFIIGQFLKVCGFFLLRPYYLIPIDRKDIHCFDDDTCYSLAFGVPAAALLFSTVIFAMGTKSYFKQPPTGSVIAEVMCAMMVRNDTFVNWLQQIYLPLSYTSFHCSNSLVICISR